MERSVSQTHGLQPTKQDPETGYRSGSTGWSDNESDRDSVSANGTESEDEPARPGSEAIRPTRCGDESSQVYETKPVDKIVISCQVVKPLHT